MLANDAVPLAPRQSLDLAVLSTGMVTTAVALAGVAWLGHAGADVNVLRWYCASVVPIGAILVGVAAGCGYGTASWLTGRRVSGPLLVAVLVLLLAAYAAAQWIEFAGLGVVSSDGSPLSFVRHFDLATRAMTLDLGRGHASTGRLGLLGYGVRLLELAGFAGGGLIVPIALRLRPRGDR